MMAPRAFPSPMPRQHGVGQARLSRTPLGGDTGCSERSWAPLLPGQLFPGFAPRLVPARVPLPATVRAPSCPSPPGHTGQSPLCRGARGSRAWPLGCRGMVSVSPLRVRRGWGSARDPGAPALPPPRPGPGLCPRGTAQNSF